eukprot:4812508-Prymnesium_polylepis.3
MESKAGRPSTLDGHVARPSSAYAEPVTLGGHSSCPDDLTHSSRDALRGASELQMSRLATDRHGRHFCVASRRWRSTAAVFELASMPKCCSSHPSKSERSTSERARPKTRNLRIVASPMYLMACIDEPITFESLIDSKLRRGSAVKTRASPKHASSRSCLLSHPGIVRTLRSCESRVSGLQTPPARHLRSRRILSPSS